jgi:two-component SAPR family response regulator
LAAAKAGDFDAAILDINLGDGMVYQVAEILARRRVPFVFVTGYAADSVDSRFRDIPVLQKPVEREMLQKLFAQGADPSMAGLVRDDNRVRA